MGYGECGHGERIKIRKRKEIEVRKAKKELVIKNSPRCGVGSGADEVAWPHLRPGTPTWAILYN